MNVKVCGDGRIVTSSRDGSIVVWSEDGDRQSHCHGYRTRANNYPNHNASSKSFPDLRVRFCFWSFDAIVFKPQL